MRMLSDIEKEYENFISKSTFVNNQESFNYFISVGILNIEEDKNTLLKEYRVNKKMKLDAKIRNFFFFIFGKEDINFYDEDNIIVENTFEYISDFEEYLSRIKAIATEENFHELTRLVDFSIIYYNNQLDYYDSKRQALECSYQGIYYNDIYNDYKDVFKEFAEKKLAEYSSSKAVEKSKKI